jgi:hypothetical protein
MSFMESLVFYLVIGIGVAVANARTERGGRVRKLMHHAGVCLFWPLYLPLLISGSEPTSTRDVSDNAQRDGLATAIQQVEHELTAALRSLDGWAEGVLNERSIRLDELRSALTHQANRIRQMETLLAGEQALQTAKPSNELQPNRSQRSLLARQENMNRLSRLCEQARSDLTATLAWIRELVSMIHLAKFTGAPAARAEELVAQIAAAVEGIAELTPTGSQRPSISGVQS